jgi:hypothetical protein
VSTVTLRHRGRKSGEVYEVQVWAATLDGTLYVASLDDSRNWVRNLRAAGSVGLLEGEQERSYAVTEEDDEALMLRFRRQTRRDHPFVARLLPLFNRGTRPVLFKLT